MVKHELLIPQMAAQIVQYIVIGVGVLLFITGTYLVAKSGTKKRSKVRNPSFVYSTEKLTCNVHHHN